MWPWSKFEAYENRIADLCAHLAAEKRDNASLRAKLNKLTDRDAKGRFRKA